MHVSILDGPKTRMQSAVLVRQIVATSMVAGVNSALWLAQDYSEERKVMRVGGSGCGGV